MEIIQNELNIVKPELKEEQPYAAVWKRLLAQIIDNLLLYILSVIVGIFIGVLVLFHAVSVNIVETKQFDILSKVGYVLIYCLYFSYFESRGMRATYGKRLLKLSVTDTDGNKLSFSNALRRNFLKIISGLPTLYIGFIMIVFTKKKQGLHDMISNCIVVTSSGNFNKTLHNDRVLKPRQFQIPSVFLTIVTGICLIVVFYMLLNATKEYQDNIGILSAIAAFLSSVSVSILNIINIVKKNDQKKSSILFLIINSVISISILSITVLGIVLSK